MINHKIRRVPKVLPVYTANMAATGVLPFVRGVDFTKNDFKVMK